MGPSETFVAVVDDDESVARAIARLLRAAGIAVDTYTSGLALLDKIAREPWYRPDCVILDVCMPEIGGLEIQRRLAPAALPVLFITAYDVPDVREKALSAGAIGYLRKPFSAGQLMDLMQSVKPWSGSP
ncbi:MULTISPECIES: response regulator transcription factor [unclassified Cupriavidus]|uniref:response regulator transcription factor n=1 Tax=unclassified Cupriavidus TaxID=2640874 RepID=UPI00088C32D6|nr:response regulator [Cupriavidus sp. YR651]SDD75837.1 Response regulator receiver domain-containing protein [Cupriavidus sp. YR651]